jgi:hypothetical protein
MVYTEVSASYHIPLSQSIIQKKALNSFNFRKADRWSKLKKKCLQLAQVGSRPLKNKSDNIKVWGEEQVNTYKQQQDIWKI